VQAIEVDYEVLDPLTDPDAAMDADPIHPTATCSATCAPPRRPGRDR
jgi:CO/xanthine dehydrogenase Mo-binding subunit